MTHALTRCAWRLSTVAAALLLGACGSLPLPDKPVRPEFYDFGPISSQHASTPTGVPIALALFGALVLLGLVRPLLKSRKAAPGSQLNAIEGEALDRPALPAPATDLTPTKEQVRMDQARALAKQNPIAVANIVKTWINGEGA